MKTGAYLSAEAPATTGDQPGCPLLGLKRRSLAGERQKLRRGGISALIPGPHPIATALITILLLTACADKPAPIVSADTSCERFAHISANEAQRKVFSDNWPVMESYADQVIAHNIEYDRKCQGELGK